MADVHLFNNITLAGRGGTKDSFREKSFHMPNSNTQYVSDEIMPMADVGDEIMPMADVGDVIMPMADVGDEIMPMADVDAGGEDAVVTFEGIGIFTPRGRYSVELHLSFFRLRGPANDFKIQYSSIVRLYLLPKLNQPRTFVVISLDPPIREGQTLYPHIVMQFESDFVVQCELAINEDLYNTKYNDKLELSYKGLIHGVFTTILCGLSGSKVTKPGTFRSFVHGYAVKSSLKAEEGYLYPLEKSFFFLPKPPTLILHEEIDYLGFEQHIARGSKICYFHLLIRLKSEQEHLFCNIQRNEFNKLTAFIISKGLKLMDLRSAHAQPAVALARILGNDDAVDPHLERIKNEAGGDESDEEDEDFVVDKDDGGSPTDDCGGENSDANDGGDEKEKPAKKKPEKDLSTKACTSKKKSKDADEDGKKKKQKEKDPNAPKRAMSGFMVFSQMETEKTNSGMSFTDVGKVLGEKWKKMSAEDKEPYEAKAARDDKKFYMDED